MIKINREKLLADYLKEVETRYLELEHDEHFGPKEIVDILVDLLESKEYFGELNKPPIPRSLNSYLRHKKVKNKTKLA